MKARALGRLFGAWAARRAKGVERLGQAADLVQGDTLRDLVRIATPTAFGREHGFAFVKTAAEFARNVPVRRYLDFRRFIDPVLAGHPDVTWPGRPRYFVKTSGTTAGDKAIPVTDAMVAQNRKAGRDALAFHLRAHPFSRLFDGKLLFLGGASVLEPLASGALLGDLSGVMAREIPLWLRSRIVPSARVAELGDWEHRLDAIAKETIDDKVSLVAGMPSWLLLLFERWRELSGGGWPIGDLFPDLELLIHGGVQIAPYRARFESALGRSVARLEVYTASEGFVAVQDDPSGEGMLLGLDYGTFYEFIPVEDLGSDSPRRLTLAEVTPGRIYSIVLSNVSGLWAYEIGDLVRFTSTQPHRIQVVGRTMAFSNCCGENLIVEDVEAAVTDAANVLRVALGEFTVAPLFEPHDPRPRLECVVEVPGSAADFPCASFRDRFDSVLRARSHDYDTKRSGSVGMREPLLTPVSEGTFHLWMRRQGRLGGQNKVPRLRNDRTLVLALRETAHERRPDARFLSPFAAPLPAPLASME